MTYWTPRSYDLRALLELLKTPALASLSIHTALAVWSNGLWLEAYPLVRRKLEKPRK